MRRPIALLTLLGIAASLPGASPVLTRDEQERFLRTADIVSVKPAGSGITKSVRATLSDGKITHDAHIQNVNVFRPVYRDAKYTYKNFKDSYKFNIAAYIMDKLLDLNMTPVSVARDVDKKSSAVTWWVDDVEMTERERRDKKLLPADYQTWNDQLHTISVFDNLIGNVDRTQENLLLVKGWKLVAIDHTRSFRPTPELPFPNRLVRCDYRLLDKMRSLNEPMLRQALSLYLTNEEIKAVLARRDAIVKFFQSEIQEKGRDAVLSGIPRSTPHVSIP